MVWSEVECLVPTDDDCKYLDVKWRMPTWRVLVLQHAPVDVWVVKEREIGNAGEQVHCRTHLGHLLSPGDIVLGSVPLSLSGFLITCAQCCNASVILLL